jgi:hypothetical protein
MNLSTTERIIGFKWSSFQEHFQRLPNMARSPVASMATPTACGIRNNRRVPPGASCIGMKQAGDITLFKASILAGIARREHGTPSDPDLRPADPTLLLLPAGHWSACPTHKASYPMPTQWRPLYGAIHSLFAAIQSGPPGLCRMTEKTVVWLLSLRFSDDTEGPLAADQGHLVSCSGAPDRPSACDAPVAYRFVRVASPGVLPGLRAPFRCVGRSQFQKT